MRQAFFDDDAIPGRNALVLLLGVCGLKLLVYEALKLLVYAALTYWCMRT
jgi:hypothetical protein